MRLSGQRQGAIRGLTVVCLAVLLAGCAAITGYDPTSYKTATDLKAEALFLIEKAKDPPAQHAAEIASLKLKLRQALEYEKGKGDLNSDTQQQWEILSDPKGGLLGEFLITWENGNKGLNPIYLENLSKLVAKAFDKIIELERHKVRT